MAVKKMKDALEIKAFEDWYSTYEVDRDGCLKNYSVSDKVACTLPGRYDAFKREMDKRTANFHILEKLSDGEVISPKPDLPNISSGETAGLVRRIARNLVQNTPNVEVISKFNDDSVEGILARHVLKSNVIGSDLYSNQMQQNLFASTKTALTLGFDCVIPTLLCKPSGVWHIKYDNIHHRDVFPDPGCKDVQDSPEVFVRRYLTKSEIGAMLRDEPMGWDMAALRTMCKSAPRNKAIESVDHQSRKRGIIPEGYSIITWYCAGQDTFLTFSEHEKLLLRIEKNNHPDKEHPVKFLVLEKDAQQPLGKSQVELLIGRQDFQDLMLNGAMKLWYRNINPSILAFGDPNAVINLGPGKVTKISNPNARVEPFEVNTQTLMNYNSISQGNLGSMVSMVGAADQQMASQSGNGMSATPQGVEAQQAMVDITTNNYQKAIESFFSQFCSYALTLFFNELKAVKHITPTAESRLNLLKMGLKEEHIDADGKLHVSFEKMATQYWVRCVPGSLVEMEDEKQLRILNEMFIPLSQAMPALAATQNQEMINNAALTMQFIVQKQIELSGAADAESIKDLWRSGDIDKVTQHENRVSTVEQGVALVGDHDVELATHAGSIAQLAEQVAILTQNNQLLLEKLGVVPPSSGAEANSSPAAPSEQSATAPTVPTSEPDDQAANRRRM